MKRLFPRIERLAQVGLAAALATFGVACSPNNNVKPGAPVLFEIDIIENGGASTTTIGPTTLDCATAAGAPSDAGADASAPADGGTAVVVDGGPCDPAKAPLCRMESVHNWCRCGADASDATKGAWNCGPFSPTSTVTFVFDRLIDGPLVASDAGGPSANAATLTAVPTSKVTLGTSSDYTANGSTTGLIFGGPGFDGPRLSVSGTPELPAGAAVTIALNKSIVLAKDGKTPFTGMGLLAGGSLTFTTAPLAVSFTVPQAPPSDAAPTDAAVPVPPDMTPVTAAFDNPVCVLGANGACDTTALAAHLTVTATPVGVVNPTPVAVDVTSTDGITLNIVPHNPNAGADAGAAVNWPASSTISVAFDATTPDLDGDTLGAAQSTSFTTGAM